MGILVFDMSRSIVKVSSVSENLIEIELNIGNLSVSFKLRFDRAAGLPLIIMSY